MAPLPLEKRVAFVLGAERPAGRRAAVALAEAGATVAAATLTEATEAEFEANSVANEFWAMGRPGIVLTTDGGESSVRVALEETAVQLGPVSVLVLHTPAPLPRAALAGLRSDPAIVVLLAADIDAAHARALLGWVRELSEGGLRANAVAAARGSTGDQPVLKEHHPPSAMTPAQAVVYLVSDATAAVDGALVVADG